MSARFLIHGTDELQAALRQLPAALTGEAGKIVEAAGNRAVLDLRRAYPVVTGKLRDGVTVTHTRSAVSAKSRVESRAPHAGLYEYGTEARHFGLARRGRMKPTHLFGKTLSKVRREMNDQFEALLERAGLKVRGHV